MIFWLVNIHCIVSILLAIQLDKLLKAVGKALKDLKFEKFSVDGLNFTLICLCLCPVVNIILLFNIFGAHKNKNLIKNVSEYIINQYSE